MQTKVLIVLSFLVFMVIMWFNRPWNYLHTYLRPEPTIAIPTMTPTMTEKPQPTKPQVTLSALKNLKPRIQDIKMLKDVGEAYMDYFGLTEYDFQLMKEAGINLIEGNFDICATDEDVRYFLNQSQKYGMKVILPAGAGEAEWGYTCNKNSFPSTQQPVWQSAKVKKWIQNWKNHPALYAWDTSNEAGSVFPNAQQKYYLTKEQLQIAYMDVTQTDPNHPVMIRMNGWFFYDNASNFFRKGNPFAKDTADIVMINAYSNVEDYYDDFVKTVMNRAITSIYHIDSDITFITSFGTWSEEPLWYLHTSEKLRTDIDQLKRVGMPTGNAFFKYGAKNSEWYLPQDAPELWEVIKRY